jgi:nucleoside-diphosphate-sugar epimerase
MNSTENFSDRHVLVVGGAGYLGNVLVRKLLRDGHRVRVLDKLIFDHGSALAGILEEPGLSFVHGDLLDDDALGRSLEGATDVVLLAAMVGDPVCKKYPDLARRVNVTGAQKVYDAADGRGIDRFVFTSTCSNYGLRTTDDPATEEADLAPVSLYAETKVEVEKYVLGRADEVDFSPTVLRISTAYGLSPRMRFDLTISEFTRTLTIGEELLVYDADTWRPYCHVADISRAIGMVLEAPREDVAADVFNVGHLDENFTKRMVVEAVQEHLGGAGKLSFHEGGVDPRNYRVNFDKIRERIGFEPVFRVPVSVGNLVRAIQADGFPDVPERPLFYTNHTVPGAEPTATI